MRLIVFILLCSLSVKGQIITASAPYRVTASAPYEYILDSYTTAAGAWSLRKLKSDYSGNCIKVRRSSDNTTQDIGFVNNEVDTASMKSFVGSNNGFIDTWYDQSGNSRDLTQATQANQPRIIDAGTVYRINGKVAVNFVSASSYWMRNTGISVSSGVNFYVMTVCNISSAASNSVVFQGASGGYGHQQNSNSIYAYAGNVNGQASNTTTTQIYLESIYNGGGAANADRLKLYKNASQLTITSFSGTVPATVSSTGVDVGRPYNIGAAYLNGSIQEIIVWFNDKSASRTGIESNVNTYYTIY